MKNLQDKVLGNCKLAIRTEVRPKSLDTWSERSCLRRRKVRIELVGGPR